MGRVKGAFDRLSEKLYWQSTLKLVGLDDDEKAERVMRLLVIHLILDRLLSVLLAGRMVPEPDNSSLVEAIRELAKLQFASRLKLAKALGMLSSELARDIGEINRVRNDFIHFKPKKGTKLMTGWNLDEIPEIASDQAFNRCANLGFSAIKRLLGPSRGKTS